MKYLASILLLYNLICIGLLYTDWVYGVSTINLGYFGEYTSERYNIIDCLDVPFYILWAIYFFKYLYNRFKGLTIFQKDCNIACVGYLTFKLCNFWFIGIESLNIFVFWISIIILTPLILKIERNINW